MLEGTELGSAYAPFAADAPAPSDYALASDSYQSLIADLSPSQIKGHFQPSMDRSASGGSPPQIKLSAASKTLQQPPIDLLPAANPINQQMQHFQTPSKIGSSVVASPVVQTASQQTINGFDSAAFHKQFDMQKRQQQANAMMQHYQMPTQHYAAHEDTYWDKLGQKKKDVWRFLQSGLIILFAISIHYLIDHLMRWYLTNNDVSFEREMLLRLLYPVAVIFIAWNIMAHLR